MMVRLVSLVSRGWKDQKEWLEAKGHLAREEKMVQKGNKEIQDIVIATKYGESHKY